MIWSVKHEALALILPKVDEKALKSSFTKAIEARRSMRGCHSGEVWASKTPLVGRHFWILQAIPICAGRFCTLACDLKLLQRGWSDSCGCASIPLVLKWAPYVPLDDQVCHIRLRSLTNLTCSYIFISLPNVNNVRGTRSCSFNSVWSVCFVLLLMSL